VDIGIAVMEAMRSGKAIVATRVGEIPVFIKDGENGFLVKPADSQELAREILKLLNSPELAGNFGQASKRISSSFTLKSYLDNLETMFYKFSRH